MTWIKLDDNAVDHPKVASLTDRAFRWWVKALSYASRLLTDGLLPPTFWKQVPKQTRSELTEARLWDWNDPNFHIHDYLSHQSSRDTVTQKRADNVRRVTHYREKKRNALQLRDCNATVTLPETDTETENRDREERRKTVAAPLVMSSLAYEKRKQQCFFVGSRLEVPHGLHADLRKQLGGTDPDRALEAWYLALNDELDESGEAIAPDVFRWLKARFTRWVQSKITTDKSAKLTARLQAIERGEIKR